MLDAVLAWVHFVAIFAFSGCLFAECFFYARILPASTLERLGRIDLAYGLLTIVVIASGVAHAIYSPKTFAFYMHDAIFWAKMGLFVVVGLLSIAPTMHLITLRGAQMGDASPVTIADRTYRVMRACLITEVGLLLCIPLCAALMARGFGYV
jgi:putative membrane protein